MNNEQFKNKTISNSVRPGHRSEDLPSGVFVQLVENRLLTELKHQVEPSLPPEHLQQVDQVHVFQLLWDQQRMWRLSVRVLQPRELRVKPTEDLSPAETFYFLGGMTSTFLWRTLHGS